MGLARSQMFYYLIIRGERNDRMASPDGVGECYACELACGESVKGM